MQLKRLLPLFLIITVANVRATVPAEARAYEPEAKSYEPAEALMRYIQNGDTSYRWAVVDSTQEADIRAYRLQLTSQTWRGIPWNHELVVLIPRRVRHREALLHISGGGEDETTGELHLHESCKTRLPYGTGPLEISANVWRKFNRGHRNEW